MLIKSFKATYVSTENRSDKKPKRSNVAFSAPSILAKTFRDNYILQLVEEYPILKKYDIQNNKGYGTKKHLDFIKDNGVTQFHRKSFLSKYII